METFLAGCFDPSAACDGEMDAMGNVQLTWDNGAAVETSLAMTNPTSPQVQTQILSSSGQVCAQGMSENNVDGCASRTVYQRTSDGATQTWCIQMDGSYEVICDDGTTIEVPSSDAGAAQACQYGSEGGACTMDVPAY